MVREALTIEAIEKLDRRDAAAHFIARRAEGLTEAEKQVLNDWLEKDEGNRCAFDGADHAWRVFDGSQNDELLAAMRAHALAAKSPAKYRWHKAFAASIAIAACLAVVFYVPELKFWANPEAGIRYEAARGGIREITLPDGSRMTLDADSAAIGQFDGRRRRVALTQGRAYFDVRSDKIPFIVTAARRRLVVVGTKFDVNIATTEATITLLEGRIDIDPVDGSRTVVRLTAGQQYTVQDGAPVVRSIGMSSNDAISWRTGLINFDAQRLDEAAAIMNRYTQDQIVIRDPAIASLKVSGQFRAGATRRFADTLAEMHKLRSVRQTGRIELVR